eukprot:9467789-Pyramimonas_sp.AAC.3
MSTCNAHAPFREGYTRQVKKKRSRGKGGGQWGGHLGCLLARHLAHCRCAVRGAVEGIDLTRPPAEGIDLTQPAPPAAT